MRRRHLQFLAIGAVLVLLWPELGVFAAPHGGIHDLLHLLLFSGGYLITRVLPREGGAKSLPQETKQSESASG